MFGDGFEQSTILRTGPDGHEPQLPAYLSLAAEWLSALGTVGAVMIWFWLVRRDSRVC